MIESEQERYYMPKYPKKNRAKPPKETAVVSGSLKVHPRGFAFLKPDDATLFTQDIFVPRHSTRNAVDGDRVEVLVNLSEISDKGPEGSVISVLERARTHAAGTILGIDHFGIWAHIPLFGQSQAVLVEEGDGEFTLKVGDRVIMQIMEWGKRGSPPVGKVCHLIGHISDPSCDIAAALEEYEIRSDFPAELIEEARSFGQRVKPKEWEGREDFRSDEVVTIDPTTAKDFDDAISLEKFEDGSYKLHVHIADVSHYVRAGSAIDEEARTRCNSTYFPGTCIPMLPPELSENLCSLRPQVNRLVVSVLIHLSPKGEVLDYQICRGVIRSMKRFTYREAKEVLDGKRKSKHKPLLHRMVELCEVLKRRRYERGSLELALPETCVMCGKDGIPTGLEYIEYDVTHQMIEEFMLKANEVVAIHLNRKDIDLPYRTHEEPSEDNLKNFIRLTRAFGHEVEDKPTPQELQVLFDSIKDEPYGQYLATSYIRSMKQAYYSPDNLGHYGLSLEYYCHFTSPIRRYPDLIVHRALFGQLLESDSLKTSAERCSEQERISAKAEMAVSLLKKLRLLQTEHEEWKKRGEHRFYEGVVTHVRSFGVFFEVPEYRVEGLIHVSQLHDDYYVYDEPNGSLIGEYSGHSYRCGDKLTVELQGVNFVTLESKWYLVPTMASFAPLKKKKKTAQKKSSKKTQSPKKYEKKIKKKHSPKKAKKSSGRHSKKN